MALGLGVMLLFAGLLTHVAISILGAIVMVVAAIGWFREVLPHEQHEEVPLEPEPPEVARRRRQVARLEVGELAHRARLPIETYPVSAGVKGGLAGSVAMAVWRFCTVSSSTGAPGIPSTCWPAPSTDKGRARAPRCLLPFT